MKQTLFGFIVGIVASKIVNLQHGFTIETDQNCNLKVTHLPNGAKSLRNLFESDDQLINTGYGYVDSADIMINGNLNEIPTPHVYRNTKMS